MNVLIILFLVILFSAVYAGWRGAPWVPTKKKDVERFLKLANIESGQKVYDIGCGDGRIICAASNAGAKAHGYEIFLAPYIFAKIKSLFYKNCKIKFKDFWSADLSDADVVYFFLMPHQYKKLEKKLKNELKGGTKVIAYVWPIENWVPKKVDVLPNHSNLYLYEIN
tara:strand:- start:45 stop:545 length:501 start_codon:yes stop_codon:yes gene_type:complete